MIETSKDIMYLAIAFSVVLVAVFTAWWLYYVAMILRNVLEVINDVKFKIEAIERFIQSLVDKLSGASAIGKTVVDAAKVVGDLWEVKEDRKAKKKKKKN